MKTPRYSLRSLFVMLTVFSIYFAIVKIWPRFGVAILSLAAVVVSFLIAESSRNIFVKILLSAVLLFALLVFFGSLLAWVAPIHSR